MRGTNNLFGKEVFKVRADEHSAALRPKCHAIAYLFKINFPFKLEEIIKSARRVNAFNFK